MLNACARVRSSVTQHHIFNHEGNSQVWFIPVPNNQGTIWLSINGIIQCIGGAKPDAYKRLTCLQGSDITILNAEKDQEFRLALLCTINRCMGVPPNAFKVRIL